MAFENEANRQLQFSLLSSKLVVRDELVRECLYMCNQNFDQQKKLSLCGSIGWKLDGVEFSPKKLNEDNDIMSHVPKFSQCSSCCCKNFLGKSILKMWLLLVRKVSQLAYMNSSMSWIHLYMNSFIQWICIFNEFMCIRNS